MTFDEYQSKALTTAVNNYEPLMQKTIWAMGIVGEAGEVIEKWKKIVAYRDGEITNTDREEIKKELGDIVWYIAVFAKSLDLTFDDVIALNVQKLQDRAKRSVIKGEGDNR
jgi:NTP pyrophosphatase (non-canonical NTP hydrolase)